MCVCVCVCLCVCVCVCVYEKNSRQIDIRHKHAIVTESDAFIRND